MVGRAIGTDRRPPPQAWRRPPAFFPGGLRAEAAHSIRAPSLIERRLADIRGHPARPA